MLTVKSTIVKVESVISRPYLTRGHLPTWSNRFRIKLFTPRLLVTSYSQADQTHHAFT